MSLEVNCHYSIHMQENLRLFATNTPETFDRAVQMTFKKYDSVKDRVYLKIDQEINEFIRALVTLFKANELSESDLLHLTRLIDAIQSVEVEVDSEFIDKNAIKLMLPLISMLARGGQTDMEIELELRVTAN